MSKHYRVLRTSGGDLVTTGVLIAEAATTASDHTRRHSLRLIRTDGGRYIISVHYESDWPGEHTWDDAHVADTLEEVAAYLASYLPCAHVRGYPPGKQFVEKQYRLHVEIKDEFRALEAELLRQANYTVQVP